MARRRRFRIFRRGGNDADDQGAGSGGEQAVALAHPEGEGPEAPATRPPEPDDGGIAQQTTQEWAVPDAEDESRPAVEETSSRPRDAEARATAAKRAESERRLRAEVDERVAAETADMRRELESLRVSTEERVRNAAERARQEAEERAGEDREERGRIEVDAARKAAEERFAATVRRLQDELDRESEHKTRVIEASDRRLQEIEQRAVAAADRVAKAEAELMAQAEALREAADRRIAEETELARREAKEAADARIAAAGAGPSSRPPPEPKEAEQSVPEAKPKRRLFSRRRKIAP